MLRNYHVPRAVVWSKQVSAEGEGPDGNEPNDNLANAIATRSVRSPLTEPILVDYHSHASAQVYTEAELKDLDAL